MGNKLNDLVYLHNCLVGLHPTGEDILIVADAILQVRNLLQQESQSQQEDCGGEKRATV